MPYPAPAIEQFDRCCGVARRSRGNHASGAETVRPSANSTTTESSLQLARMIRSPGFAMDCLPFLQQIIDVILDHTLDVASRAS
jgi:hypothetical protein